MSSCYLRSPRYSGACDFAFFRCVQEYSKQTAEQQFSTRFLLREVSSHIAAMERPLDTASEALDIDAQAKK